MKREIYMEKEERESSESSLISSLFQLVRIVGSHPTDPGSNPGRGRNTYI